MYLISNHAIITRIDTDVNNNSLIIRFFYQTSGVILKYY
jgi:hypothetical protein